MLGCVILGHVWEHFGADTGPSIQSSTPCVSIIFEYANSLTCVWYSVSSKHESCERLLSTVMDIFPEHGGDWVFSPAFSPSKFCLNVIYILSLTFLWNILTTGYLVKCSVHPRYVCNLLIFCHL
jgi:hypothetical protein